MIDIRLLRDDPDSAKAALARRGVEASEVDAVIAADVEHRAKLAAAEAKRAEVKELSRQVGAARKAGDQAQADELSARSRALGEEERAAAAEADELGDRVRTGLLYLPNIPADETPDGLDEEHNVELRRWWPGQDLGRPEPERLDHQSVPHWEIGEALQILDMERGARLSGSMFPLYRGPGARLLRALTAFAIDHHSPAYEEIRPPTVVLTETITSTGHLPKFADDAYHVERDDLWLIPTAEVPLTSMHRGEILEESQLPMRFTAATPCYRREAGSAGRDTRGLLRVSPTPRPRRHSTRRPTSCGGPSRCCRSSSCPTGCSICAPATSEARRPARSTWRRTRRASTAGSRSPRSAGTATTSPGGPTCVTGRRAAAPCNWCIR